MKLAFILLLVPALLAQSFEVASVKPHQGPLTFRSGPLTVSSPLIRLEGYTVYGLVLDAYHIRDFQLKFAPAIRPEDVADTMYDVAAKAPGDRPPRLDDVRAMMRNLLAERFKLTTHRETKEMPVYDLVPAQNGPKLKASSGEGPCIVQTSLAPDGRNNQQTFSNCSIEVLADVLVNIMADRPVLDQTGLTGTYDFRLLAIPEYRTREGSDPNDISALVAVESLGLKLVARKGPVEILVVDHFEKPTGN
jgi:uncharacterized protein (TIGR03435 family)